MSAGTFNSPFANAKSASADLRRLAADYLDGASLHPEMQRVRTAAFEVFAPTQGERLLDAGCGAGEVARQLATRVGVHGSVTAMDLSEDAILVARSRDDGGPVTYTMGDVTALDFSEGHFDGVRCERVLQHLQDPDSAVRELVRVTREGGRVCVIDTDWASCVGDGFEHLAELVDHMFAVRRLSDRDRSAGRTARARMIRTGLRDVTVLPVTLRFTSPVDAGVIVPFFNRDMMKMFVSKQLLDRFFVSVDRSAERGDFLFAFTMWITQGRVRLHTT
ncbi:methyltransferase domain-containing protein [Actinomadura sp. NPDC048955]|uniref:methyltransferase domain-containing protein n=1 Tax=Actinomadura sp. NPDC048955 TaxID=3158228 RepID=UPI0033D7A0C8